MTNLGWNYPPGTNPNDPHIVGHDEGDMEVYCGNDDASVYFTDQIDKLCREADQIMDGNPAGAADIGQALLTLIEEIRDAGTTTTTCDFEGSVTVVWQDRTTYTWTCPYCGTEHEGEVDDGPDPDYARDLARDLALDD